MNVTLTTNLYSKYVLLLLAFAYTLLLGCGPLAENNSKATNTTGSYINANSAKLYFTDQGSGHPILLLHGGFGTNKLHFEHQYSVLNKDFRIISLDTRGHGKSTFDSSRFTYDLFAEDAFLLLEKLNLDSVTIIGFSDGAITGLILAGKYPQKVKRLVAIAANTKSDTTAFTQESIDWVKNLVVQNMVSELTVTFPNYPDYDKLPEFVHRMKKLWLLEPNLTSSFLATIDCPTLLIAGEKDDIKIQHQRAINEQIKHSSLHILTGAGHSVQRAKPTEVNELITDFIGK